MAAPSPFPGLFNPKAPESSGHETRLLEKLGALWDEGKRVKEQWCPPDQDDRDLKLYRGEIKPSGRDPFFEDNFIQAFIDRMVAQLTDNRPVIRMMNRKAGLRNMARVMEKIVSAVWEESEMQRQAFKMAHNAAVSRSAGLYTGYDPIDDEIYLELIRRNQVVFDPSVSEAALISRGDYVIIERVRPLSEVRERFPGRGDLVKADTVVGTPPEVVKKRNVLSPLTDILSRKTMGSNVIPMGKIKEALIVDRQRTVEGKRLFPACRRLFYSDDVVLLDEPLPYWDGTYPLDWFDWTVDPEHPWGNSECASLMRMQLAFNQVMDGLVENQLLSNVLTVTGDSDAIDPTQWKKFQNMSSSLILRKTNRNASLVVTPPPTFGADKIALARTIFTMAQMKTGVTDVTLGETPGSLQSGQAIEGLQEGANLMTRARASRLEDFFMRVGQKLVSRILQFMSADAVLSLVGPTGEAVEYAFNRQELFKDDKGQPLSDEARRQVFRHLRFRILPGSSAPGTRARRAEMMMKLLELGIVGRRQVLEAADFQDPEQMLSEAKAEMKEMSMFMPKTKSAR